MFGNAYDKCYEAVSVFVAWLLCWPMKLTFVCNLVQALGGSSICDPEGKVDTGIGEGYIALKSIIIKLLILPENKPFECWLLAAYVVRTDCACLALTIDMDGILFR